MSARVLVIALDAYEKDLLLQWAAAGELPVLGALLQRATWGITEPPPAVYAGAVWPSFSTGTSPAHHRRFFCRQAPRGEYLDGDFKSSAIEGVAFWDALSDAGRKIAVFDVPHYKLSPHLNGIQVVDWAPHAPETPHAQTYPAALRQELVARYGPERPDQCEEIANTPDDYRALFAHLEARLLNKIAMSRHYLGSADWDFFLTVFGEAHCAGHQWWHLHDPTHPAHEPGLAAAVGNLMKAAYVAVDRAVGEVVADAGPETRVVILCSHGMGPRYGESVALDEVLRRLEAPKAAAGSLFSSLKRAWYMLPPAVRSLSVARDLRVRLQQPLQQSLLVRDRQARRFFAVPHNPHSGAIRINVVGRETHGLVQPGTEYRALCANLREELLALKCPETNQDVVAEVAITADLYEGPFADELPDLIVEWSRRQPVAGMSSPRIGSVPIPTIHGRTGDHTGAGLFLAAGAGLTPQRLERAVPIVDFAPTFTTMLGVPAPATFAGKPTAELLGR
jgi:predicted AlkP superfamily phosphohydrolase/phosphomutase